ncbi:hypothetical protein ABXS71_17000 [Bacillus infantis]|uniref:hypothetical protein n=1 Tax=Bacillus infantis TaxID=324767 RepID=UPI00344B0EA4
MHKKQFLAVDKQKVIAEVKAGLACADRIAEKLVMGDLQEAKLTTVNLLNSIRELELLEQKKVEKDAADSFWHGLIERLESKGVNVAVVMKIR